MVGAKNDFYIDSSVISVVVVNVTGLIDRIYVIVIPIEYIRSGGVIY